MTASRLENADVAIARRDVLGMAKGLMMASVGCGADEAFAMLAAQASAEGRKAFDVADELVQRHQRRITAK
jgi:AmiR/NasT family two-component response regulator